jgi:hypothetical protein
MRTRDQRGAALAWAMLLLAAVSTAVALSGAAMARRVRLTRLATEAAALEDLSASAVAVGRQRARDASWRGPAIVDLAGGTATVQLDCDDAGAMLRVEARAKLTGRVVTRHAPLEQPRSCPDPA